jgi:hypothetical protein
MSPTRSEFPAELLAGEPSFTRTAPPKRPARLLITFCLGVAATLAWQSYGDTARGIIANLSPQLGWLAPQPALAQTDGAATTAATPFVDQQEFKAMSLNLAAVRQRIDQLAVQVAAGQEQVKHDFTMKLQAAEQDILGKIPGPPPAQQPAAAPARRPAVPAPSQQAPLR